MLRRVAPRIAFSNGVGLLPCSLQAQSRAYAGPLAEASQDYQSNEFLFDGQDVTVAEAEETSNIGDAAAAVRAEKASARSKSPRLKIYKRAAVVAARTKKAELKKKDNEVEAEEEAPAQKVSRKKRVTKKEKPQLTSDETTVEAEGETTTTQVARDEAAFSSEQILSFVTIVKEALVAKDQSIAKLEAISEKQSQQLAEAKESLAFAEAIESTYLRSREKLFLVKEALRQSKKEVKGLTTRLKMAKASHRSQIDIVRYNSEKALAALRSKVPARFKALGSELKRKNKTLRRLLAVIRARNLLIKQLKGQISTKKARAAWRRRARLLKKSSPVSAQQKAVNMIFLRR